MNRHIKLGLAATLIGLLAGCGKDDIAPAQDTSPADIFVQACRTCHGAQGSGKFGFLLKIAGTDESVEEIGAKIRDGGWIMPKFPNLSEDQRQALAAYIKSL